MLIRRHFGLDCGPIDEFATIGRLETGLASPGELLHLSRSMGMHVTKARGSIWLAIVLGMILESVGAPGATPFVPPENPSRFVIAVEKSEATSSMDDDIRQTVFDLVYRGANGHMPDGSVFEIWTFGDTTTLRGFVPQMLSPDNRLQKASLASAWVRSATNSGPTDIVELGDHLKGAVALGYELTLFLVTAPVTRLEGIPRVDQINGFLDANAERMIASRRPFVTALRIQDGQIVAHSVNDSVFTMSVPPMPVSALTDQERETLFAEARRARAERDKPPEEVKPVVAVVTPPVRRVDPGIPDEEREGAIILRGNPRNTESTPGEGQSPKVGAAANEAPAVSQTGPDARPEESAASTNPATPKPSVVTEPVNDSPASVGSGNETAGSPPTVLPSTNQGGIGESDTFGSSATAVSPGNTSLPPGDSSALSPIAANPGTWLTAGGLFVAGLCFFVVAGLLAWVLLRRAKASAGPSYITRSIDESSRR
ncbi:MAG TPA: hypothetical protein DCY13_04895 [Verrucomicrobiales bacterium]|nr:hypothetical protein [Verrucomicrobiales bacterium]